MPSDAVSPVERMAATFTRRSLPDIRRIEWLETRSWDEKRFIWEMEPGQALLNYDSRSWTATDAWERHEAANKASRNYVLLGLGLGVSAFLVHGLLDSFLAFTPTALLLFLLLGMILGQKPHVSGR